MTTDCFQTACEWQSCNSISLSVSELMDIKETYVYLSTLMD